MSLFRRDVEPAAAPEPVGTSTGELQGGSALTGGELQASEQDDNDSFIKPLLGHLAAGTILVSLVASAGAAYLAINDGSAAQGFLLGCALVVFFFSITSLVVGWAEAFNRQLMLPVGLATYVIKILAVGAVVFAIAQSKWAGFDGLIWGIAIGTVAWVVGLLAWGLWLRPR